MNSPFRLPWRMLKAAGRLLLALLILFEEWGWAPLARLMARFARLPGVAWLEGHMGRLPPRLALAVLFLPMLLLLPVKLGALWLIACGRAAWGVLLLVVAKIAGTAGIARLFSLTQPQLMRLSWFARWYAHWVAWKRVLLAHVRASAPWVVAAAMSRRLRAAWRGE